MNAPVEAVVGIDVSKKKLDVVLMQAGKVKSKVVLNTPPGHAQLQRWLLQHRCVEQSTHVCLEATGPYSEPVALALRRVPVSGRSWQRTPSSRNAP